MIDNSDLSTSEKYTVPKRDLGYNKHNYAALEKFTMTTPQTMAESVNSF